MEHGIRFEGGAFELNLPLHLEFAGVKINGLKLGLPLGQSGGLPLHFSTSLAATFGPFSMVLDQIGLETEFDFEGSDLGIGSFNIGFKRPTGIGVSIDGGAVSGGGFLSHDPRYTPTDVQFRGMLKRSAAALSGVRRTGAQKYMLQGKPKLLTFGKPKFVVASSCDLTWNTSITQEQTSYTKALLLLREHERNHPEDRNRFRVVAFHAAA